MSLLTIEDIHLIFINIFYFSLL